MFLTYIKLYVSLNLIAVISAVHVPVSPACCTVKFTLNIVGLMTSHFGK